MVSRDLDEFLRKAAERRNQKAAQRRVPVQAPAQQAPTPAPATPQRPKPSRTSRPNEPSQRATYPAQTSTFAAPAVTTLAPGPNVDQADERMSDHLHETFDHQMGQISDPIETVSAETPVSQQQAASLIDDIRKMFADPQQARKAFIIKEILDRPEHQW